MGKAPRGGEDILHLEKPSLAKNLSDPQLQGYAVLQKIFFAPTESSQAAGAAFIDRLVQRKDGREPISGPDVAQAQMAAYGERFETLEKHSSADTHHQRYPRRDDSRAQFLLAE